jgi:ABC-type branched-subunit amino acid transport system ATPase component/branched-subunit amino acid ABC-type transport system permease component
VTEVIRFAVLGLGLGAMYALAAQGLILVYRGSGVLNFAHGATAMASAFVFYDLRDSGWGVVPALLVATLAGALIGALIQVIVMRRLRAAAPLMRIVATLSVMVILQGAFALRYGTEPRLVASFLPTDVVTLHDDIRVGADRIILLGIAIVVTAALWAIYRMTRFGLSTTAVAENELAASVTGRSPDRIALINWAAGGALAALAGVLLAPLTTLQVEQLTQVVIASFAGALIARFSSFPLALVGGLFVGVVQTLLLRYSTIQGLGESAPFLLIILTLVIRGTSLPGRGHVADRLPSVGTGRVRGWLVAGFTLGGTGLLLWVLPLTWVSAVTVSFTAAVILLSIVVVTGYSGQLSLAQYVLAGVGALIAGRAVDLLGVPFLAAVAIGVVGTIPVGLLFAIPALRARGAALAVATLGIGLGLFLMAFNNADVIGGVSGTQIGSQSLFGLDISAATRPERYAVVVLVFLVLALLAVASLRRSRSGRRLLSVRDNERAAASLGISVIGAKAYGFGVAAGLAALGGILLAFQGQTITYEQFNIFNSINATSLAVIGGLGYIAGPLLGSGLVPGGTGQIVADQLYDVDRYIPVASGVIVLLIILANPDGLARTNLDMFRALSRRVRPQRADAATDIKPVATDESRELRTARPATLAVSKVTVRFGAVVAVDGVSLDVHPGEVLGLLGPNGAGKTTLVDAITGFVPTRAGTVTLGGESLERLPAHRRSQHGLTRSFQSLELFESMTVRENLLTASDSGASPGYVSSLVGGAAGVLSPAAMSVIDEFELASDLDRLPAELSYGRRRLVAIARAVATNPAVVILDEPAAGLSEHESDELGDVIRSLSREWGIGVLLIEHNVDLVMRVSDRITVLNFGKTIAEGTPAEVRADPLVRTAYLGETSSEPVPVIAEGALR